MATRHHIGRLGDLSEEEGLRVEIEGEGIAVFRRGDEVFAVGDSCPHMGASLSEGFLGGEAVVCPWHGWGFDLTCGTSVFDEEATIPIYRVLIEEGEVFVEVFAGASESRPAESGSPDH